jgi:hypothetical protein
MCLADSIKFQSDLILPRTGRAGTDNTAEALRRTLGSQRHDVAPFIVTNRVVTSRNLSAVLSPTTQKAIVWIDNDSRSPI